MIDVGEVAGAVVPYLSATAGAYGAAVVQRVSEDGTGAAVGATVGLGRRLLQRLLSSSRSAQLSEAVTDLASYPGDDDLAAQLRIQVRKALAEDVQLANDLAGILARAGVSSGVSTVTISGSQGVQVGHHNQQSNTFGPPPDPGVP